MVVAEVFLPSVPLSSSTIEIGPAGERVSFLSQRENVHVSDASASVSICSTLPTAGSSSKMPSAVLAESGAVVVAVFALIETLVFVQSLESNSSDLVRVFCDLPNPPYGVIAIPASNKRLFVTLPSSPMVRAVTGEVVPMPTLPRVVIVRPVEVELNAVGVSLNLFESD